MVMRGSKVGETISVNSFLIYPLSHKHNILDNIYSATNFVSATKSECILSICLIPRNLWGSAKCLIKGRENEGSGVES